jgi:hypothetical protein
MNSDVMQVLESFERTEWCQFLIDWGKGKDHVKPSVVDCASSWQTCAVGELLGHTETWSWGFPLDYYLFELGGHFAAHILDNNWVLASNAYIAIVKRHQFLLENPQSLIHHEEPEDDDNIPF